MSTENSKFDLTVNVDDIESIYKKTIEWIKTEESAEITYDDINRIEFKYGWESRFSYENMYMKIYFLYDKKQIRIEIKDGRDKDVTTWKEVLEEYLKYINLYNYVIKNLYNLNEINKMIKYYYYGIIFPFLLIYSIFWGLALLGNWNRLFLLQITIITFPLYLLIIELTLHPIKKIKHFKSLK
ncbi:MAG: hypothetical protein WC941_07925 [Candidatus Bathyarchaeia archaeon]